MTKTRISDRSTWVIYREYQDAHGIVQTEYKDLQGNIHIESKDPQENVHLYQNGYVDGVLTEKYDQEEQIKQTERADKNISQGLILGVILTCLAGLSAGAIYFLVKLNNPQPATIISVPTYQSTPTPTPTPAQRQEPPVVKIVPVPQTQPREVKVNITTQSAVPKSQSQPVKVKVTKAASPVKSAIASPQIVSPAPNPVANTKTVAPAVPMVPVVPVVPTNAPMASAPNRNPNSSNLAKTDSDLKNEILQKFQNNLGNNQLIVEVNQGNVKIAGMATTPEQLREIPPLLQSIQGIENVEITATSKMLPN